MRKPISPVSRRNQILILAVLSFIFGFVAGQTNPAWIKGFWRAMSYLLIAAGGAFFAWAIREFADVFLQQEGTPWYIRPGTTPYLFITIVLSTFLGLIVIDKSILEDYMPAPFEFIFMNIAFILCGILILDWPKATDPPRRLRLSTRLQSNATKSQPSGRGIPMVRPFNTKLVTRDGIKTR